MYKARFLFKIHMVNVVSFILFCMIVMQIMLTADACILPFLS